MRRPLNMMPASLAPCIPDHFDGAATNVQYAASAAWPLGPMSLYAEIFPTGTNAATNQYLFSTITSIGNNGVRWNYTSGSLAFAADTSGGGIGTPAAGTNTAIVSNNFYATGVTWDGGLLGSGISMYMGVNGAPIFDDTTNGSVDGSGSVNFATGRPVTIGNRDGALIRIFLGDILKIAWWNRALTPSEMTLAQQNGPQTIVDGLVLCRVNGRDIGPFNWIPATSDNLTFGAAYPYGSPAPLPQPTGVRAIASTAPTSGRGVTAGAFG